MANRTPLRVRNHILKARDGKPLAYARALVDFLILARREGNAFNDFAQVLGNYQLISVPHRPRFLGGDRDAFVHGGGVVSANLRSNPVFEGSNNFSASRVVFGISRENQGYI